MLLGSCCPGWVTATGTSLPATAGLRVFSFVFFLKAKQKPPVVPGLLPSCFLFLKLESEREESS